MGRGEYREDRIRPRPLGKTRHIAQTSLHEINRDICATVDFEGIRVGISSLGDPDSEQEMWLDELVGMECDIIVCASRTKGRTVRAVEERAAANGYALI